MSQNTLLINQKDNVAVALVELNKGDKVLVKGIDVEIQERIPVKHKFTLEALEEGGEIKMYGLLVGYAKVAIGKGERIATENTAHAAQKAVIKDEFAYDWTAPKVNKELTFNGYKRKDGQVGIRNTWLVAPLVFCQNRNILEIKQHIEEALGYNTAPETYDVASLISMTQSGDSATDILESEIVTEKVEAPHKNIFPNVDGVKFITHQAGCGGTRADARRFCQLLAGYLNNPNVGGATILSLGCQNAQISMLKECLAEANPNFDKPLYILEQQKSKSEKEYIGNAIKSTVAGLGEINKITREPASISELKIGLECGGSDGFSGISANPLLGQITDMMVGLGGTSILGEFPELNGVEQDIVDRCTQKDLAVKFLDIMKDYEAKAVASGSGFDANPSPGNIKDGLITDAMKSAGAAKKGGSAPIVDVLDYTEQITKKGLNLLCTPGNDVESTTALVGSGATMVLFTTGLGTPTGNPAAPVLKVSSNTMLSERMSDIIDFNAGTIVTGEDSIQESAEKLLEKIIRVANGEEQSKSEMLRQDDFIVWKKDVSL